MSILPQRYSIKYHIICHFSVVVALVLIVSGVTIFSFVYENVRQNMMEKLAIATTSVKDVVENAARLAVRNHLQAIAQMNIALLDGLEQQVRTGRISKLEAMKRGEEIDLALEKDLFLIDPEETRHRSAAPLAAENRETLGIHSHEKEDLREDLGSDDRPLSSPSGSYRRTSACRLCSVVT